MEQDTIRKKKRKKKEESIAKYKQTILTSMPEAQDV